MNLFLALKNEYQSFFHINQNSLNGRQIKHIFICFSGVTCEFVVHISGALVSKCQASNAPA